MARRAANGLAALKNTGTGLYDDFSGMPDKFGRQVRYAAVNFKKFGVVQDLYEDFNNQLSGANQSVGRLESEVADTANQINRAGSLVETEKLKGNILKKEEIEFVGEGTEPRAKDESDFRAQLGFFLDEARGGFSASELCVRRGGIFCCRAHVRIPTMQADMRLAMVPASIARSPSLASSPR